ncbi:MAG: alpha/beta hydrolase [Firmicutes bacterium]|jgi:pimeloyl-ACP methyl ester carboxylesterase|nr:alpha/beta hydrolase [Bacillota bacterium]
MYIDINDVRVHYEIEGNGIPLLCIHGYYADHRLMKGMMEAIIGHMNIKRIYLDLPGMGLTENYSSIKSADDFVSLICDFVDEIIPEERFLIAGFSYGGYLSRAVHKKKRELVDGIVLVCPAIYSDRKMRELPKQEILLLDENIDDHFTELEKVAFNKVSVIQDVKVYERYKKEILVSNGLCDFKFLVRMLKNNYSVSFDVDHIESLYEMPALIICGRQDSVVGYKDAFGILSNYKHIDYHVIDGAGHNVHFEREELFNSIVLEWFERVIKRNGKE